MQSDFQLGAWRVQPQLNSLACDLRTVHLEPKMMGVLLCLAQRSGDVVSKERIVQEVWQDTFVTDDVLIRCVSELRKVFGDTVAKPAFIETIPKKGYRLLVPVTPVLCPDEPSDHSGDELADSIAILPFENTGHYPALEYLKRWDHGDDHQQSGATTKTACCSSHYGIPLQRETSRRTAGR